MDEFYKKINDKLEKSPEIDTDWSIWDKVEKELYKEKRQRIIPFWVWPLGMLAFGLLGYVLGGNMESNFNEVEHVEVIHDTIYIDKVITQTDTVFQDDSAKANQRISRFVIENRSLKQQLQYSDVINMDMASKLDAYGELIARKGLLEDKDFLALPNIDDYKSYAFTSPKIKSKELSTQDRIMKWFPHLDAEPLNANFTYDRQKPRLIRELSWAQMIKMKSTPSFLEQITPDYLNFGVISEGPSILFNQNQNVGKSFGIGAITEVIFSPKFSIYIGVVPMSYSTGISDATQASFYPQPASIGENEIFEKLEVLSSSLEVPISLKYRLKSNKWLEPYIVGGVSWVNFRDIEYKYEYKSGDSEIYYELHENAQLSSLWAIHGGLGATKSLSNSFDVIGEVRFNYQLGNESLNTDKYYGPGLRLGLLYKI